jgi:hypothetical protein
VKDGDTVKVTRTGNNDQNRDDANTRDVNKRDDSSLQRDDNRKRDGRDRAVKPAKKTDKLRVLADRYEDDAALMRNDNWGHHQVHFSFAAARLLRDVADEFDNEFDDDNRDNENPDDANRDDDREDRAGRKAA